LLLYNFKLDALAGLVGYFPMHFIYACMHHLAVMNEHCVPKLSHDFLSCVGLLDFLVHVPYYIMMGIWGVGKCCFQFQSIVYLLTYFYVHI